MKLQKKLTVLLSVSMLVLLVVSPRVFAGPDLPVVSGPIATFTGDQSDGIWPASLWSCPPVYTYNVYDLTDDITPATGVGGIRFYHKGANGADGVWKLFSGCEDGFPGSSGGNLTVNFDSPIYGIHTFGAGGYGIKVSSEGGDGGSGASSSVIWLVGGNGGNGGNAGSVNISSDGSIQTDDVRSPGIFALSQGGKGGNGGSVTFGVAAIGGHGGVGGDGADATVHNYDSIITGADDSYGILAQSLGGNGGIGGNGTVGVYAKGGNGGAGGDGATVTVTSDGSINTGGDSSHGIDATSQGGIGGNGGAAPVGAYAKGGHGGAGGDGRNVTVTSNGSINTAGDSSYGIYAVSEGGDGGNGGTASWGAYAEGGDGGKGGSGGTVNVNNDGNIETAGNSADGIVGKSLGGAGGDGGFGGGAFGRRGGALGSGPGGTVVVNNTGDIQTSGTDARGIFAESVGGFAGSAGGAAGLVGWGGSTNSTGDGGAVTVTNSGAITTTGDSSEHVGAAILAQSIGGGGGDAASSYGLVALGGSGSAGGNGGEVKVTNSGQLQTFGNDTYGIMAQSAGGGGGSGGSSYGLVALGGSGESTGDGDSVEVENTGDITTAGDGSASIFAQSIGGGGGVVGGHGGTSKSPIFSMGGSGASGGDGDTVTVNNSGNLTTSGLDSSGIFAQSVGGGGGAGGGAYAWGLEFAWTQGGDSETGGNGGQVDVSSVDSTIITEGEFSHGIHAQSVGGGGGSGGNATNITVGIQYSATSSIGGDGGNGGYGDAVNLTSGSTITTQGEHAHGLYAQSIGGGGGSGGNATNWTINIDIPFIELPDLSVAISVGGTGGDGGIGKVVTVDNTGDIDTSGFRSYGIFAQSVGGGGGEGGNSMTGNVAINSIALSASIGGDGSGGGSGGAVDVENSGNIATQGDFAYGILGQSIGGGGGAGGNSTALIADIELIMDLEDILAPDINSKMSIGGTAGGGGDGKRVDIINTGNIVTNGDFANGILAQSVGGGGGAGGDSTSIQVELTNNPLDYIPFFGFLSVDNNILIGGDGGVAGDGGEVVVTNNGNISTKGNFANGIMAQSVGGGGGTAGYIYDDSYRSTSPTFAMSLGAEGGAGGKGGKVKVTNDGNIGTQGDFAQGILAQSIGGGGGSGGHSQDTTIPPDLEPIIPILDKSFISSKFSMGGHSGVGSDGGEVEVTNNGNISTEGNFANGILAQSVGGGGGTGGNIHVDPDGLTDLTSVMVFEGSSGGSGSGGNVTVVNNGDITTDGGFAHGILAQSIGGGGGFGGISEDGGISTLDFDPTANGIFAEGTGTGFGVGFAGSSGGLGSAGAVSVTHTGSITTFGDMSHGILAQSAAGTGTAGPVTVTLASDITANGMNSDGIHAQSIGDSGNGDISINIGGGTVRGGSGTGAGVNIDGGSINTLTNAGSISALSGLSIIGGVGDDTVYNNGIVTGTVDLGAGDNAFNNNPAGVFNSGAIVNLGSGNILTNAGVFSPGGSETIINTILTGDLFQAASGLLDIEIGGFTPGTFDFIDITGTADLLDGTINFSFLSGYDIASEISPGESMVLQFLQADLGISSFASNITYDFLGSPLGFQYNVFQQDNGLFFQANNTIPSPGAILLGSIGVCFVGWLRRRRTL